MTNNPTIDGVSRKTIERIADHCKFWKDHAYIEAIGDIEPELRALLDAPVIERQPTVIDLDAVDWETIQKAAGDSNWMPNEYMRNEWVSDVCNFLKYGRAEHPAPPEVAALQSTIAQLRARVAELESGRGEPVVWIKPDVLATLRKDECCYAFGQQSPKGTMVPLFGSPQSTVKASLWEICVRDEPGNPESPCEYVYASSASERDSILRQGGASLYAEYAFLDATAALNEVKP